MKVEKVVRFEVKGRDLDDAVTEFLREKGVLTASSKPLRDYECVAYEEWGNDETHTFSVSPIESKLSYGDRLHFKLGEILDWMCFCGKIEKGDYLVDASW